MITIDYVYYLGGAFFAAIALLSVTGAQRNWRNAAFWGLLAISFLFGSKLSDVQNGVLVLGLVGVGAWGLSRSDPATTSPEARRASAEKRGNWMFAPALLIPLVTFLGVLAAKQSWGAHWIDPKQSTFIALIAGVLIAVAVTMIWAKAPLLAPLQEGRRLIDAVGWAAILPQMLASLGAVFLAAGVGDQVGKLITQYIPLTSPTAAVTAYCLGMALFTVVMGNAFAAFPVMTAAVGLPIVVRQFGGDPIIVSAVGMLAGFCGTLTTPMAANFNVVPANLLDLPDRNAALNGVIRAQIPTALPLLLANIVLMRVLAFHGS